MIWFLYIKYFAKEFVINAYRRVLQEQLEFFAYKGTSEAWEGVKDEERVSQIKLELFKLEYALECRNLQRIRRNLTTSRRK